MDMEIGITSVYYLHQGDYVLKAGFFRNYVLEFMKSDEERKNWSVFDADSATMWLFIKHFYKEPSRLQLLNQGTKDKRLLSLHSLVPKKSFSMLHASSNLN